MPLGPIDALRLEDGRSRGELTGDFRGHRVLGVGRLHHAEDELQDYPVVDDPSLLSPTLVELLYSPGANRGKHISPMLEPFWTTMGW